MLNCVFKNYEYVIIFHDDTWHFLNKCWLSSMMACGITRCQGFNTLRLRQNGRHFPDNIFKCICLNETVWISIKISLEFVPKSPINYSPALVQIMAWHRPGDKPLSGPFLVCFTDAFIYVTLPQWINRLEIDSWTISKHCHIYWWILPFYIWFGLAEKQFDFNYQHVTFDCIQALFYSSNLIEI